MQSTDNGCNEDDEIEVPVILRIPGQPDREVVARLPRRAVPGRKK